MKKIPILLTCLILLSFSFQSCKKNRTTDLNPNINVADDVVLSVCSYTSIFNLLIKARLDPAVINVGSGIIDSAFITYDPSKLEYDINFFSAGSPDGVRRSGQIIAITSGDLLLTGTYVTILFQDYYEDYGKVGGIDTITNVGTNADGQVEFSNHISQGSIEKNMGFGTVKFRINSSYTTQASSLVTGQDILFMVKGNISGISSKGYAFSASVHDVLHDSLSCPWISQGFINVKVPDAENPDGYIDFVSGDGCSNVMWYYFGNSAFKVLKTQYYLKN